VNTQTPGFDTIFCAAIEIASPEDRAAYLAQVCGDNVELRGRVQRLVDAHFQAGSFLEKPQLEIGATAAFVAAPTESFALDSFQDGPGTVIGHYKLLEQIGEGGMGSVWMAQQTEPVKRTVAVKLIKSGSDSKAVLARFEAERQALALMDHPNIAKVLDAGTTDRGTPFFVMELIQGMPIREFCDTRKLTPRQRLELFVPVCQAIQHAHQKGIIHRDIKPSNVLVTLYDDKPVPKVIDFGVAKATWSQLTEQTPVTGFGAIVGTPQYMSPEQATLNNVDIDTRSDIYSLGVLLYELLAGSPPFDSKEPEKAGMLEILRLIREEEPPKPSTKVSTANDLAKLAANRGTEAAKLTRLLRGEIDWIVMKALEKARARRYETANGFAQDVQRYLADEPVLAGPPSASYRVKKFVKRHKGPVVAVGLVLLALLLGMAGTTVGLVRAEQAWHAEAKRAEGERLAKTDARNAAEKEKEAKEQATERLKWSVKANEILSSIFRDLDPELEEKEGVTLRVLLGRRLDEAVRQLEGESVGDPVVVARLQSLLGDSLRALGHYEQAEVVLTKARQTLESSLGATHADTLTAKENLAQLYHEQGKCLQAEALAKELLEVRIAQQDFPSTLDSKNLLALIYEDEGKYPEAETLLKEVVEGRTALLGPNHQDIFTAKDNLALLYQHQGKYPQAEAISKDLLELSTARLGADNLVTLTIKNNLALVYEARGKYALAEALLKELVQAQVVKVGPDHPHTLTAKNNLALVYDEQRNYQRAEALYKEVLEGRTAKLGADHPNTLHSKGNLAGLYRKQGKYPQAEALYKEAVEGFTARLGAEHPDTLTAKANLAELYEDQEKYSQAEALAKEVLEGFTARLGAEHPRTLTSKGNLAALYWRMNKWDHSIPMFEEVAKQWKQTQGAQHPDTLLALANLGVNYRDAGRLDEGIRCLEEALAGLRKLPDPKPINLTSVPEDLAQAYERAQQYAKAAALYEEVLEAQTAELGADHAVTLNTKNTLGVQYWRLKKWNRSIPLYEEMVEQQKKLHGAEHRETLFALANLGVNYRDAGRLEDGLRCLEDALAGLRKLPDPKPGWLAWLQGELVGTYDGAKQYAKAEPLYREFLQQSRKQHGDENPRTVGLMAQLGLNLLAQKKYDEAEKTLRECLVIREKKQPDDWSNFNTKSMLGDALLGQKKFDDAEPLLKDGYVGMKQRREKIPEVVRQLRITEALQRLVRLYEATGNTDEAAKWLNELETLKDTPKQP
jgi:serine/threonine protein kinase